MFVIEMNRDNEYKIMKNIEFIDSRDADDFKYAIEGCYKQIGYKLNIIETH